MPVLLRRLLPFAALFLCIESATRILFLIREWPELPQDTGTLLSILGIGALFDVSIFAYLAAFLAFCFLLIPTNSSPSTQRGISRSLLFLFTFTMLFTATSEWFFWDEFRARFNFIAVDYLVYTHEVIGNIRESYPVVPLILVITVASLGVAMATPLAPLSPINLRSRAIGFAVSVMVAGLGYLSLYGSMAEISDNNYANETAKNGFYELFAAFWNNELSYSRFYVNLPEEEARTHLSTILKHNPSRAHLVEPAGREERYNVVLITIESMSANFMAAFGNDKGLTPNMDKIAKESLFFTNLYATGTRTVYGLAATSLGMPPLAGNAIVRRPNNGSLFTLATVLNSKGYQSKFIYGGFGYFDNMNQYFGSNGYKIVDRNELAEDEKTFANVWGVSDEDIFTRTLRENDKSYAEKQPFFDHIMTTSNHRPFTYPDGRIDIPSHSGRAGAVKYTDYAIGKFLADASKKPWFDKTIFIITADHTAGNAGKAELDPAGYHIPMMIYAPKLIAPKQIDTLTSQIDIPPTILGLMNMHYESKFWGQDAVRNPPNRAFISNYQKLGYLTNNGLTVLKPVKQVDFYRKTSEGFSKQTSPDAESLRDALSYYQSANHWQNWQRVDPTSILAKTASPHAPAPR
jgi:phosphoglycerol transferase MdoB-like AlkP superfamily enzyme